MAQNPKRRRIAELNHGRQGEPHQQNHGAARGEHYGAQARVGQIAL